jgi:hypothetical protein
MGVACAKEKPASRTTPHRALAASAEGFESIVVARFFVFVDDAREAIGER